MIRNVLEHIGGLAAYAAVAVVLFVCVFIGMIVWVLSLKRADVERMSRLPLQDRDGFGKKENAHHD